MDFYATPREYYKFLEILFRGQSGARSVIDLGCGPGEFLHFLKQRHPAIDATGVEINPEYLDEARRRVPTVQFRAGDAFSRPTLPDRRYDAVFSLQVVQYAPELETALDCIVDLCDDRGRAYIFTLTTGYPVDVEMKARFVDIPEGEPFAAETCRLWSEQTLSKVLRRNPRVKDIRYYDFDIGIDIPAKETPNASWTVRTDEGKRLIITRMNVLYTFKYCVVQL